MPSAVTYLHNLTDTTASGFRQFLLRGPEKVRGEWSLICTVYNLCKLAQVAKPR